MTMTNSATGVSQENDNFIKNINKNLKEATCNPIHSGNGLKM